MNLRHAVITSVDRDDLPDFGACIFAETIRQIHERLPGCSVEVLVPDFQGNEDSHPHGARGAPGHLQSQHRDGPAPLQEGAARAAATSA